MRLATASSPAVLPADLLLAAGVSALFFLAACGLAACGQPAPPLPPSLNLPAAPTSFTARREGPAVALDWQAPRRTTDGARQRGSIAAYLCIWPTAAPRRPPPATVPCPRWVRAAPPQPAGGAGHSRLALDRLTPLLPGGVPALSAPFLLVALDFANARDRLGERSGWVVIPATPVSPPPEGLAATLTPQGIELRWQASGSRNATIRIERCGPAAAACVPLADVPAHASSYWDTNAAWGQTYRYQLRRVAGAGLAQVVSAASTAVVITARRIFPPPRPAGLEAVLNPASAGVDLSWMPVVTTDLAGYNVYRRPSAHAGGHAGGMPAWEKRNAILLLTPVFHDAAVPAGSWQYAVSAVDAAGNESGQSAAVAIIVPLPSSPPSPAGVPVRRRR